MTWFVLLVAGSALAASFSGMWAMVLLMQLPLLPKSARSGDLQRLRRLGVAVVLFSLPVAWVFFAAEV